MKDKPPGDYRELSIEATRLVAVGPNDVVVAFQLWDMANFEEETSILFRAKGFEKVERLAHVEGLAKDLWFGDGELVVLGEDATYHLEAPFKKPTRSNVLPMRLAKSIGGSSARDLYAVGSCIAHFDGKRWSEVSLGEKASKSRVSSSIPRVFRSVTVTANHTYAAGDDGRLVAIGPKGAKKVALTTKANLRCVDVDTGGVLSIAGERGTMLQGPPSALRTLEAPKGVTHATAVCEFKDKRYWSFIGKRGGVYEQRGAKLVQSYDESVFGFTTTPRFLYAAGGREVFRFDGTKWRALAIEWDEDEEKWMVRSRPASDR